MFKFVISEHNNDEVLLMKKAFITLFFFVTIASLIFLSIRKKEQKTLPVFIEDDYEICLYILNFEKVNLTTRNFISYFEGKKIEGVSMKHNPLYVSKLNGKIDYYSFSLNSISMNLKNLEKDYTNLLNHYHLFQGVSDVSIYGVSIAKVKMYGKAKEINDILYKNKDITYERKCGG